MKTKINGILGGIIIISISMIFILLTPGCEEAYSNEVKGVEYAKLTKPPMVPPPITRKHASKVVVDLETVEVTKRLADGVDYTFWTYGGNVPGDFIRVREGDVVEFNLHNHPTSKVPHNIDLHAVTGPGGGAEASFTAPGHTSTFSFTALNPGLYVYHCATAPVGMHIANGMYGLIFVEPKGGLHPVDREFYVVQSEFYTEGNFGVGGLQPFDQNRAIDENPSYVVFNGSVGALTGENSLQAKTGETIRIFLGNGGPNLISSFHVIGEIFDNVYGEGGTIINQKNVQTTIIPAGGSAIVEFKVDVPGRFILVDHSIFRAFHKGAIGMLEVSGDKDLTVYSGKQKEGLYFGSNDKSNLTFDAKGEKEEHDKPNSLAKLGKSIYDANCLACHGVEGMGVPNVFPPLAKSDYLNNNKEKAISAVVHGLSGPITVNGKQYNQIMPPVNINDEQVAAVLTYVYNSFGNSGKTVTAEEVKAIRTKKVVASK